jgi:protocatechuate 3,4-dioxygenase beta subunit
LTGWVHDPAGRPVVDARVRYASFEQRTDDEGGFRLALPTLSQEIHLMAEAEGFAQKRTRVHVPETGEARVDIELPYEFRVRGRVLDEDGAPIAGAAVTSFYTQGNHVITDASGRYSLGSLDPGRPKHMIDAKKQGYAMVSEEIETNSRREAELDLAMRRGVRVEGRVLDENGTPLEKVELYIGFSAHDIGRLDAITEAGGRFAFTEVGPGPTKLVAQFEGFAPFSHDLMVPMEWTPRMGVEVVLQPGHFIGGRVADTDGEPLEGVFIAARYHGEYIETRGSTDAEGLFRIEGLPADHVALELYKQGLLRLTRELERLDDDGLAITMQRSGSVAGRVLDGRSGEPLSAFRIRFVEPVLEKGDRREGGYSASWVREGLVFTDSNGAWDTGRETLTPGAVIGIEASAPGFANSVADRVVVSSDPDPDALVLRLFPGTTVRGQVVDARDHTPVEGALVKRFTRGNPINHSDSDDVHGRMQVRSDAAGQFEFPHVPAGEMSLLVEHPDYSAGVDGPFELSDSGGAPDRSIALSQGSVVTGTLRAADGAPLPDQKVVLSAGSIPGLESKRWEARTDGQGSFRFERIADGVYRVAHVLEAGDYFVDALARELRVEGGDMAVELRPRGSAVLRGILSSSEELPPNLTVIAERQPGPAGSADQGAARRGTFSRDGRFEFLGLEPGTYELRIRHRDWHQGMEYSARDQVTLEQERELDVTLDVQRKPYR